LGGFVNLLGRDSEKGLLDSLLDTARAGLSGVVVVRGEPGVGKTALLDYVVDRAADFLVVHFTGVEPERDLGYAALHRLLTPILHQIERLPAPQRDALNSALGLAAGPPANPFLVGLGTISLAANAARARKRLLTVIDDAHWIDRESLEALAFWGRRIRAEGIALVFATRDTESASSLAGFDAINIGGLSNDDARTLLAAGAGFGLDRDVVERIVKETGGNPLAIVELAKDLTVDKVVGMAGAPQPLALTERLEEHFAGHVRALPADTQMFLLTVAADASADAALVWRAVTRLGVAREAAEPAEAAGLVVLSSTISYRHPLIRSAVYARARAADRRAVHRALAAATDADTDAERRAWHLAAASMGADEDVAGVLEQVADGAHARGSSSAELALLTRAAELTPDPIRAAKRRLRAADAALLTGAPHQVHLLVSLASTALVDPGDKAWAKRLEGAAYHREAKAKPASVILREAAVELIPTAPGLGRQTLMEALEAALLAGDASDPDLRAIATAALAAPAATASPVDQLLNAYGVYVRDGFVASVDLLRRAVGAALAAPTLDTPVRWSVLLTCATEMLWDQDLHDKLAERLSQASGEQADLNSMAIPVWAKANSQVWSGHLIAADGVAAQAADIYAAAGESPFSSDLARLLLRALRGEEHMRTDAATVTQVAEGIGNGVAAAMALAALTKLDLGRSRYADAVDHSVGVFDRDPVVHGSHILADLVEAAVRVDRIDAADSALARLAERATAVGTEWSLGLLARCRALMAADAAEVEASYREALERLGATRLTVELGRTHLLYGEWLRRQKRRSDARDQLRLAHDLFDGMGAAAFAKRARDELLATGERVRRRTVDTVRDLTPQESHIADLAAGGDTNPEIAAQLFISASTVEYHMRKVFVKLGITSRRELRHALPRK
jgi:DNA-binding CsgD family transcriptional regulator